MLTDKNVASQDKRARALVTGIHGFTGAYVAKELENLGFEVFGTSFAEEPAGSKITRVDLRNAKAVRNLVEQIQPEVVIHLAAISFVGHEDISEIYEMNIVGTRNLLSALANLAVKPKSVVLASSANVYGNSTFDPISELAPAKPANDYAVSKLAMEQMAMLWVDQLPITMVRPFNYTGVGQSSKFLIPKIVDHFKFHAEAIELGNTEIARDFSDVRTVSWAYGQLALNPAPGEIFNIASGVSTSLGEIIDLLRSRSGHHIEVKSVATLKRTGEVLSLRGDASKLWKHIGQPREISLQETLSWMLAN
jgi:nucleoside-diphosphate-sugar epimerase